LHFKSTIDPTIEKDDPFFPEYIY